MHNLKINEDKNEKPKYSQLNQCISAHALIRIIHKEYIANLYTRWKVEKQSEE